MKTQNYSLYRTEKKTAKENHLIQGENHCLIDLSLLDSFDIPDWEKEAIRESSKKQINSITDDFVYYYGEPNSYMTCGGIADFNRYNIINTQTWKQTYRIFQLAKIEGCEYTRSSIFDDYDNKEIRKDDGYIKAIQEIEI